MERTNLFSEKQSREGAKLTVMPNLIVDNSIPTNIFGIEFAIVTIREIASALHGEADNQI